MKVLERWCKRHIIFVNFRQEGEIYGDVQRVTRMLFNNRSIFVGNCYCVYFEKSYQYSKKSFIGVLIKCNRNEVSLSLVDPMIDPSRNTGLLLHYTQFRTIYTTDHCYRWKNIIYRFSISVNNGLTYRYPDLSLCLFLKDLWRDGCINILNLCHKDKGNYVSGLPTEILIHLYTFL